MDGPIRVIDLLNCIVARSRQSKPDSNIPVVHSSSLASTHTTTHSVLDTTPVTVLCDYRIVRVSSYRVYSHILGSVMSLLSLCPPIKGRYLKTLPLAATGATGLAVNEMGTRMVVSFGGSAPAVAANKLYLYSLPDGERLNTNGGRGSGPGQCCHPKRVCFGPDDVIIVADYGNNRLQQFNSMLEYNRTIPVDAPFAVVCSHSGDLIAVSSCVKDELPMILLLEYRTGNVLRGVGHAELIRSNITSVRFNTDDSVIAIASLTDPIALFHIADGTLIASELRVVAIDVTYVGHSHMLAVDCARHCVVLYHHVDTTATVKNQPVVARSWGKRGRFDGQFSDPVGVAYSVVTGCVYVLDSGLPRVQMFD